MSCARTLNKHAQIHYLKKSQKYPFTVLTASLKNAIIKESAKYGRMAQLVEHIVHIDGVTGSSPVATTFKVRRFSNFFDYIMKG